MFNEMEKRRYTQRQRAERQAETRRRIVEAMVALHQELGPANTTVKAIAERAGVERLTVYRHFPDEQAQLQACSSHYLAQHPPPAPAQWARAAVPAQRLRRALKAFYNYYRQTAAMFRQSYRDAPRLPALRPILGSFEAYLDETRDSLMQGWEVKGRADRAMRQTLRHGLSFATWESLESLGLSDEQKARLVSDWVRNLSD